MPQDRSARVHARIAPGVKVIVNANPVARVTYRGFLPENGTAGVVTAVNVGADRATHLPGPYGGMVFVQFPNALTMGVSPNDLDLAGSGTRLASVMGLDAAEDPRVAAGMPDAVLEQMLRDSGMHRLGERNGKAGTMWGINGQAREIAVGKRDLQANVFLVSLHGEDYALRRPDTRWNNTASKLKSQVTPELIAKWAAWVKSGPTMVEVRDAARAKSRMQMAEGVKPREAIAVLDGGLKAESLRELIRQGERI